MGSFEPLALACGLLPVSPNVKAAEDATHTAKITQARFCDKLFLESIAIVKVMDTKT